MYMRLPSIPLQGYTARMQNSPLRTLLVTVAALLIIGVGAYAYIAHRSSGASSGVASSTIIDLGADGKLVVPAGATVTEEDVPVSQQAPKSPDFRAAISYSASVPAEARTSLEAQRQTDITALTKNSQDYDAWMNLAVVNKIAGDYSGSEAIWLYVTNMWPKSPTAFSNLADLYKNFLHDSAKAKVYADLAAKLAH